MSAPARPIFSDGAILGAGDLTALSDLDAARDARATRYLHTPGVASGLGLVGEDRVDAGGKAYVDVTVQPGYAIDGTGRELVVDAALAVSAEAFQDVVASPAVDTWYPVFIKGVDLPLTPTSGMGGCQGGSAGPTRISEQVEVAFGRAGDQPTDHPVPAPGEGAGSPFWQVLVGYVQFSPATNRFSKAVVDEPKAGLHVPTAGAAAGVVAGQHGRVELRPTPEAAAGGLAVVLDAAAGTLVFGKQSGAGNGLLTPLVTVDASGNLKATGTLSGMQSAGELRTVAGVASDGVRLPLPAGVDEAAVASGALAVSVMVTPRMPAPSGTERFLPAECRVDADRRVRCWGTWFDVATSSSYDAASSCDYLVIVSVP